MLRQRWLSIVALLVGLYGAYGAGAAESKGNDAARAAARDLGYKGVEAYQAGDYAKAVADLSRAFDVVKVPTLGLWLARALVKQNRLVEASERYRQVMRIEVNQGKIEAQKAAQADAKRELEAVEQRLAYVTLNVEGADAKDVALLLDGVEVAPALVGVEQPVDPGTRTVTGRYKDQQIVEKLDFAEGQRRTFAFEFKPVPNVVPSTEPQATEGKASKPIAPDKQTQGAAGSPWRTVGWVSLGVGGAGLVLGSVTGVLAMNSKRQLDDSDQCANGECGPPEYDNVDSYNRQRLLSSVGFIAGGLCTALGVTLLFTVEAKPSLEGSRDTGKPRPEVRPYVGLGSAGVVGQF